MVIMRVVVIIIVVIFALLSLSSSRSTVRFHWLDSIILPLS